MATVWQRFCAHFVATFFATDGLAAKRMEPTTGLEPVTCALRVRCSTVELRRHRNQDSLIERGNRLALRV